ncbi:carboxypeptidase M32 [Natrialbaceae archaeon A-chndr2]
MAVQSSNEAYEIVLEQSQRVIDLEKTNQLMRWDSDVMMPPGGAPARSSQRTTLSAARHRYLTDDRLGDALETLEDADLEDEEAAIVREVRREYTTASRIPEELNDEISKINSQAHEAWKAAREADDWSRFGPHVAEHFEAKKRWSNHVDPDGDPYAVVWSQRTGYLGQPHISLETVDRIFDTLREELVPLIEDIHASDATLATDALCSEDGGFDTETQKKLNQAALDIVGLDWERTRFDVAPHPFSFGNPYDVRMTTRYDETDLTEALTGTLHEFGHTAYAHGLNRERYGTPLGEPRGIGIHESQSRFFENHIGRTQEFWEHFMPTVREHFPQLDDVTARDAYECVNQVFEDNFIRVEADELTYHMHIILRTEIERDLFHNRIDADEIPQLWNDKMEAYLGIRPSTDNEGCLQDPHWSRSLPGFIGYTIGSVLAAQLDATMREELNVDVDDCIRNCELDPIRGWLTENVHSHGQFYRADELIRQATGEDLTAEYFVEYVNEKYGELYDL